MTRSRSGRHPAGKLVRDETGGWGLGLLIAAVVVIVVAAVGYSVGAFKRDICIKCYTCKEVVRYDEERVFWPWDTATVFKWNDDDCAKCRAPYDILAGWDAYCLACGRLYDAHRYVAKTVTRGEYLRNKAHYDALYAIASVRRGYCPACAKPVVLKRVIEHRCVKCSRAYWRRTTKTLAVPTWRYRASPAAYSIYRTIGLRRGLCYECGRVLTRVTVWVSNSDPPRRSNVTVFVRSEDQHGRGIRGAVVQTRWHYKTVERTQDGRTGPDGVARLSRPIGNATLGYEVVVVVRVAFGGEVLDARTSFTPR